MRKVPSAWSGRGYRLGYWAVRRPRGRRKGRILTWSKNPKAGRESQQCLKAEGDTNGRTGWNSEGQLRRQNKETRVS